MYWSQECCKTILPTNKEMNSNAVIVIVPWLLILALLLTLVLWVRWMCYSTCHCPSLQAAKEKFPSLFVATRRSTQTGPEHLELGNRISV